MVLFNGHLINTCTNERTIKSCADPEGGHGIRTPLKNHKNIRFRSNTGPYPPKTTKLLSQHSMLDHHRHASGTPYKWDFAGGPMMACF